MSVLSAESQQQVEAELVAAGVLSQAELDEHRSNAAKERSPLFAYLLSKGKITDEQLTKTTAKIAKVPYVNLSQATIEPAVLELLSVDVAERYMAVPLGEMQNRLVVAMLDADNVQAVDFLSNKIGRPIKVYSASETGIRNVLKQYNANMSEQIAGEISNTVANLDTNQDVATKAKKGSTQKEGTGKSADDAKNIKTIVQDSPISKALSAILEYAAQNRASDIHIEPLEAGLKIRCRIDGVLREIMKLPKSTEPPLISRIKILANLKIDEHRIPQDGEFSIAVGDHKIDLRISISPVIWGEQVVIRLLDKSGTSLQLETMGYRGRALRTIKESLGLSNGMILTSGPTGSGKSTSLYALLNAIKSDDVNIVTLEDPVEYKMDGINQIQVNHDVGLTFSAGLRSILRQDPDVVMVGEIRDKETAELAVQAALTGHLVFSTLHTNSAAGILPRLLEMGIEPFLIASTVRTVIGQRLLRRNAATRETYAANKLEVEAIHSTMGHMLPKDKAGIAKASEDYGYENLPLATDTAYTLTRGVESADAPGGYKGRIGVYEVFGISSEIQDLIVKRSTSGEIQKVAREQGMVGMREDGYLKAIAGETTISEVNRVLAAVNAA